MSKSRKSQNAGHNREPNPAGQEWRVRELGDGTVWLFVEKVLPVEVIEKILQVLNSGVDDAPGGGRPQH